MSDTVGQGRRGQSELLGIVLLFGLVITVSLTVVVVGGSVLSDAQSDTMKESAEVTMIELQSKAAQAGSSGASIQEVSFVESPGARPASDRAGGTGSEAENAGNVTVEENSGSLEVEVTDSSGSVVAGPRTIDLGQIIYEREGERVAYQGGGVFRKNINSGSSAMVSPPNFQYQYRNGVPTLSMPVTAVRGGVDDDDFSLSQRSSSRVFPTSSAANPIKSGHTVTITVESEYYRAWGNLFEKRTDGTVTYNDGGNTVTLELDGPPSTAPLAQAALSSSEVPQLNGPNHASIDSYHSGTTTYNRGNGPLYVRGDFRQSNHFTLDGSLYVSGRAYLDIQANAGSAGYVGKDVHIHGDPTDGTDSKIIGKTEVHQDVHSKDTLYLEGSGSNVLIEGDVYVGADGTSTSITRMRKVTVEGDVHVQGDMPSPESGAEIKGDLYVDGSVNGNWGPHVDGTIYGSSDVATPADPEPLPPVSNIDGDIDAFESSNDDPSENNNSYHTSAVTNVQAGSCGTGGSACELTGSDGGSQYYLPGGIDVRSGEKLILDTSDGPISIYAGPNANGDNGIYLNGGEIEVTGSNSVKVYTDGNLNFEEGAIKTSPTPHRAENFRVYMRTEDHSGNKNKMKMQGSNGSPSTYTGVFMSPDPTNGGEVQITQHAEVFGSLIGEVDNIANHAAIHFDEALLSPSVAGPAGGGSESVAYLQMTERVLEVS